MWKRNKREERTIPLYLPPRIELKDKHLVNFHAISCWNVTILHIVIRYDCHLLSQNVYLKLTLHPISNKLIVWVNSNSYLSIFTFRLPHTHTHTHTYICIYIIYGIFISVKILSLNLFGMELIFHMKLGDLHEKSYLHFFYEYLFFLLT